MDETNKEQVFSLREIPDRFILFLSVPMSMHYFCYTISSTILIYGTALQLLDHFESVIFMFEKGMN